jgi:glycosyltransferase involved in cell wall biosynthesis
MSGAVSVGAAKVVVGIPVHNSERFLAQTLRSVAAQDYPNLDIVISDDASTDGTMAMCRAFARTDSRVRAVGHAKRVGWIANYNSLLQHATGDYFLWVPHDDLYEPSYIREMVELLERRLDAVLAWSATLIVDADGRVIEMRQGGRVMDPPRTRLRRAFRYLWWTEWQKGMPFHGVVRSSAVQTAGGLKEVKFAADDLWLFRLSLLGTFAFSTLPLCRKRQYPGSTSSTYGSAFWKWDEYIIAHCRVVREAGLRRHETAVLLTMVWFRRAWLACWWLLFRSRITSRLRWYLSLPEMPRRLRKFSRLLRCKLMAE